MDSGSARMTSSISPAETCRRRTEEAAVTAACTVLRRHVSAGEIEDVMRALPESIRALLL